MAHLLPTIRGLGRLAPLAPLGPLLLGAGCAPAEPPAERAPAAPASERSAPSTPALRCRLELPVAGEPEGVLALDLDGDGRDELLALSRTPGVLTRFERLPRGWSLLAPRVEIAVGDYALGPVDAGRAGGRRLVAVASRATRELLWIDPLAEGVAGHVSRASLAAAPRAIASGDLGADGSVEVVVVDAAGVLSIHRPEGIVASVASASALASCARVRLDGGGVVVADQGSQRLAFWRAEPGGGLLLEGELELPGMPRALAELDLDGDGDGELLVAGGDRSVWVLGAGTPGGAAAWVEDRSPRELQVSTIPLGLTTGAFGGDGTERAAALCHLGLRYVVLEELGGARGGRFDGYAGQAPWALAGGDFDGDGLDDLATANRDAGRVGLLFGAPGGGFLEADELPTGLAPHSVAAADFAGDGGCDLAVINALEDSLVLLERRVEGWRKGEPRSAGPGANHARAWRRAGERARVVWTSSDANGTRLCTAAAEVTGLGTAVLPSYAIGAVARVDAGRSATDLVVTDLDGDGEAEAWLADFDSSALRRVALPGPEAGEPGGETASLALPAGPVALTELDLDGRRHLAVACAGEGGVARLVFVRVGPGGTPEPADSLELPPSPRSLAAGDVDGDGATDLCVLFSPSGGESFGRVQVLLRRPPPAGWLPTRPLPTGQRPFRIAAGDLDGDGRADAVVSAQNSHDLNLYLAAEEGEPGLRRQVDLGAGMGCLDVRIVDLDGDGAPEIVAANAFSHDVSIIGR